MTKRKKSPSRKVLRLETLEDRRCLAAVSLGWDGAGLGDAELSYYVGKAPASVSQAEFESAIEAALKVWSDVIDVTFTQTNQAGLARSLDFTSQNIDGAGGTLAQAYFPATGRASSLAGDVTFDSSEAWEVGNAKGASAYDLIYVAVHEIGHALGLDHSAVANSVMAPTASASQVFTGLAATDVDAALALYAPAVGSGSGTSTSNSTTGNEQTNEGADEETEENSLPQEPAGGTTVPEFGGNRFFGAWRHRFGGMERGHSWKREAGGDSGNDDTTSASESTSGDYFQASFRNSFGGSSFLRWGFTVRSRSV